MKIAVITSIYGRYDQPVAPVPQDVDCDWILVSDEDYACPPWRTIVEPRPGLPPRLASRVAKCRPDLYTGADVYLWVDASIQIIAADFVSWAVSYLKVGPLAQFRHPGWQTLTEEVRVASGMRRYAGLDLRRQVAHYEALGLPPDWGLWASGIIVYRHHVPGAIGDQWLREQLRWTSKDQLSHSFILWRYGPDQGKPVDLPGNIYGQSRFMVRQHAGGRIHKSYAVAHPPP